MLVLTEPISSGSVAGRSDASAAGERAHLDRVADGRSGAVRLDVSDLGRRERPPAAAP